MKQKFDALEIAKIIGEPIDPQKPYPDVLTAIADTDTALPEDYIYYFDALLETDKVYIITSSGSVTQENVVPDTPVLLSFADIASPEYYVKITDLAKAKERTLARKVATINRAMNAYETYKLISLIDTAVQADKKFTLTSGTSTFNYQNLVYMIDSIQDYSDTFHLLAGTTIDRDIRLWDWTDNKYTSLKSALGDLNVTVHRQFGSVTVDDVAVSILAPTYAYLVGVSTPMGKPILWVRKQLNDIDFLGGALYDNGDKPERLVFVSPNPVQVEGTARFLAVAITGLEEYAAAVKNPYALARFIRS